MIPAQLLAWQVVRGGDRIPIATVASYGPRWVWLLPVAILALFVWVRKTAIVPLAIAAAIGLVLVMQLEWRFGAPPSDGGPEWTVVSLNTDGLVAPESIGRLARETNADVLCIQEAGDDQFAHLPPGWSVKCAGGLCTASRTPIGRFEQLDRSVIGGHFAMATAATLDRGGPVTVVNVHLETVREGIEPAMRSLFSNLTDLRQNLAFRRRESQVVTEWIRPRLRGASVITGDFNMPSDSALYREYWSEWTNAFAEAGTGFGYTKHTSWWGIRIDHLLATGGWTVRSATVAPPLESFHRPIVIRLQRSAGSP